MKANNLFKIVIIILFILFIALYLGQATGYYEYESNKKWALTNSAIKRYEQDLKQGKEIEAKNYLQEEKNYSNSATKLGFYTSELIEKSFNLIVRSIFNQIGKEINKNS